MDETVKQPEINGGRGVAAAVVQSPAMLNPGLAGQQLSQTQPPTLSSHISILQELHNDLQNIIKELEDKAQALNGSLPLTNLLKQAETDVPSSIAALITQIRASIHRVRGIVSSL